MWDSGIIALQHLINLRISLRWPLFRASRMSRLGLTH